jgi:hypothetical protein
MQDILTRIARLNRPRLLSRAARIGASGYRRELHLPRLLEDPRLPRNAEALLKLSEIEAELNTLRVTGAQEYHLPRHVEVLIAIVGESALLRSSADRLRAA